MRRALLTATKPTPMLVTGASWNIDMIGAITGELKLALAGYA